MTKNRYTPKPEYWYDTILGIFFTSIPLYLIGHLLMLILNIEQYYYIWLILIIIITVLLVLKDNSYRQTNTGKSKKDNFDIVKQALYNLGWEEKGFTSKIELSYNKYILKFLEINIEPASQIIHYNFRYSSTTKIGRPLFFFGICTFCEWCFRQALKKEIAKK